MGHILSNEMYLQDIRRIASLPLKWERLRDKIFLVSGASGMIGSFLLDVLLMDKAELNMEVIALVRNETRARERFAPYLQSGSMRLLICDINDGIPDVRENVDYVIHAASNTHPRAYATQPVQTLMTNIAGTYNMLRYGIQHEMERFVFLSSVEIYGENRGDVERFDESYCGYLDCSTLRAGYPEGKRAGEALCHAYIQETGADIVIPRLPRVYGPTMLMSDTKAISQFIQKGVAGEDIVLKSKGTQLYSYIYVADAVSGILQTMLCGRNGEAYNVADADSDIALVDLAGRIAEDAGVGVVFDLPDAIEQAGYSKATKALLDSAKLQELGWKAQFRMQEGIHRTLSILCAMRE